MRPDSSPPVDPPSAEARAVRDRLVARIGDEIESAGGWIPFARFMELALYAPGLGYYSAGATKFGRMPEDGSDFVTAPELTPLFARTLARGIADALPADERCITEFGGGSGRLAAGLLDEFAALGVEVDRYRIVEVSADLRTRQRATIECRAAPHAGRVEWVEALPDRLPGVVLANEVLDAMPVHCVVRRGAGWVERGVVADEGGLAYADRVATPALVASIRDAIPCEADLPDDYQTERHSTQEAFVRTVLDAMTPAATLFLFDYGFPASEYFHPQRAMGTLVAHRAHRVGSDLLADPGLQDLTAHVDFSAVARAARDAGGRVLGYASQAAFLLDLGILDVAQAGMRTNPESWARDASALQRLLSEAEMGELFKVMALGKRSKEIAGFSRDRSQSL